MIVCSPQYVRSFIIATLQESIVGEGLDPANISDDLDLLTSGLIDSLGLVELIAAIERHLGVVLEMSDLDPEHLTIIGPLSDYIGAKCLLAQQPRLLHDRVPVGGTS